MKTYDANVSPDPAAWLQLSEEAAHQLVARHHRSPQSEHPKVDNPRVHDMIHVIVENQAALGSETAVAETIERLQAEGLTRHEAVHAIGGELAELLYGLRDDQTDADASRAQYDASVRALSAEGWRAKYESSSLNFDRAEDDLEDNVEEAGDDCGDADCGHHHHPPSLTIRRPAPKVGRNDPCPCGSGKKFKKCCLAKTPE